MINNVLIYPNYRKNKVVEAIDDIASFVKNQGCSVEVINDNYDIKESVLNKTDLVLVLGGDGSIIDAARIIAPVDVPIVGINFGKIGFLAQIDNSDKETLSDVLKGNYTIQKRMMIDVSVIRNDKVVYMCDTVFNDAVVSNGPLSKILDFDLYANNQFAEHVRADGVIFSTPTGSSAYSMSAGGPLLEPTLKCICVTPICPQKLNLRPCVFNKDTILEIKNLKCRENRINLSMDGKEFVDILPDDIIRISKSPTSVSLVMKKNCNSFVQTLYSKLTDSCF